MEHRSDHVHPSSVPWRTRLNPFLVTLGWTDLFKASFASDHGTAYGLNFTPGRIVSQSRSSYRVQVGPKLILEAVVTTRLRKAAKLDEAGFPTVGDWVSINRDKGDDQVAIHGVLERKNLIQRRRVGNRREQQLIAANVDFLCIVTSLNEDFDLERLGSYLRLSEESGVTPALILTKADLCEKPVEYQERLKARFPDVESFAISDRDPASLEPLRKFFGPGLTAVLVGSSGVGKSTLSNFLLGAELQKTSGVSADVRGKHTTTARNLFFTRWGGMVIDTPGMQEVAAVGEIEKGGFPDIEDLILKCKFTNCRHGDDPGCAVMRALTEGALDPKRWQAYQLGHRPSRRTK